MNERIKELAKQAGLSYLYDYDADGHAMVCSEKDIKKFAELIVRECIQLADQYGSGGAGSDFDVGYTSCANTLSDEFKKRFGVEE